MNNLPLRHPNVMSDAERLALPDPARPIDSLVIPAAKPLSGVFAHCHTKPDDTATHLPNSFKHSDYEPSLGHHDDITSILQWDKSIDIQQFIHEQQHASQTLPCRLRLPLSLLPKLVKNAGLSWWEQIMTTHPTLHLSQPDQDQTLQQLSLKLYLMGQMYHTMLCVFLLCQCKSRQSLNQQVTLQELTDAINAYAESHQSQLAFLTQYHELVIEPKHVEFAVIALGWRTSKQHDIGKRYTTISSQNPLTGC